MYIYRMKKIVLMRPSRRLKRIQLFSIVVERASSAVVIQRGRNLKRKIERARAVMSEKMNIMVSPILAAVDLGFGSLGLDLDWVGSSSTYSFAEKLIACVPTTIISKRLITPRMRGMFRALKR